MYNGKSIGVVVPAYNEEGFIGEVIDTVPEFVDRVFVIDDASTDDTWTEIQNSVETAISAPSIAAQSIEAGSVTGVENTAPSAAAGGEVWDTRIIPVRHETNRGRGGAVKTGYRLALVDDLDIIAVMDGDGQMDPEILTRIIDPVVSGRADYAKGNRLVDREHCQQMSRWRFFGNVVLTLLTKIASRYWGMRDPQNGYTAISADALEQLSLTDLYEDYGFLNDLLIRLGAHGMRIEDVPMEALYADESSGIRYSTFIPKLSLLLLRGFIWRVWVSRIRNRGHTRSSSGSA